MKRWAGFLPTRQALRVWLRRIGCAAALTSVAGVGAFAYEGVWQAVRAHPYFAVEQVAVSGAGPLLSEADVRAWLRIDSGASVWDIDPDAAEERLRAHPIIAHARARRTFPHSFAVAVRERQPRALLLLDDLFYVDRHGDTFGPLAVRHERDFPVITGVSADAPSGYRKWALRRALNLLRRCERRGCPLSVSELHLDPESGIILYPRHPPVPVVLGWQGWDARIARAARVLESWNGATDRLARVDARFLDQVVVTLQPPADAAAAPAKRGGVSI